MQGSGGGGAGGSGDSARASDTDLYALWNAHIKPVRDCAKCETARGSPEACAAYTTEGKARGKTCMAHMKRACCLWAHSLSVAQIAAHTKSDPRFSGWKDDALRKLAKKFMQEMKGATPLGTPNEAKPKNSFQVPLYSGNPLRPVKTDGTPTNGASGSGHYWVFMGHQWQGARCSATCRLPLATLRLPLAACRLPLAARRLPLAACRLPLAACRLPLAACQLLTLLAASHLSQAPPRAPAAPPTRRRCRRRMTRAWRR